MIAQVEKGKKTTLVALIFLVFIIALFVGLFFKIVDGDQVRNIIDGLGAAAIIIIGFLSKDADAKH